jgi:hypothetical protein
MLARTETNAYSCARMNSAPAGSISQGARGRLLKPGDASPAWLSGYSTSFVNWESWVRVPPPAPAFQLSVLQVCPTFMSD